MTYKEIIELAQKDNDIAAQINELLSDIDKYILKTNEIERNRLLGIESNTQNDDLLDKIIKEIKLINEHVVIYEGNDIQNIENFIQNISYDCYQNRAL